jgi:uncharacterized protein YdeI (YjbR/CyaY-like superfamily)
MLKWVMAPIPFDAAKVWGKRGQLPVKGEVNGFAFRSSLFPDGNGGHRLLVTKQMQRGAKAAPGMAARFRIEPDTEPRVVAIPAELKRALAEDRALVRWFGDLSRSARNEICKIILQVKSSAARSRRAGQMAERLFAIMEAEKELPPALQLALDRNSLASEGWRLMPPSRRRGHLWGIFYYQSLEGRARRTAKMVEDAVQLAEKKKTSQGKLIAD